MDRVLLAAIMVSVVFISSLPSCATSPTMPPGVQMPLPQMIGNYNMSLPAISFTRPPLSYVNASTTMASQATTTIPSETAGTTRAGSATTVPPEGGAAAELVPDEPAGTLVCGNDLDVCYVELDITGNNRLECCDKSNNPTCRMCLTPCTSICGSRGKGVKYCFGTDITFGCECSNGPATCQTASTLPVAVVSTTQPGLVDSVASNTNIIYLLLLLGMFAVLIALVYYVRNI